LPLGWPPVSLTPVSSLRKTARASGLPGWFVFNLSVEHERLAALRLFFL
jgi:hypothetical protein